MLASSLCGREVMLVDDDESLRRALGRAMRLAGIEVKTFSSAEALLAQGLPPPGACLVIDVDLPGMTGTELRRTLLAAGWNHPVIFITGLDSGAAAETLCSVQSETVLRKPFGKAQLLEAIGRVCGQA